MGSMTTAPGRAMTRGPTAPADAARGPAGGALEDGLGRVPSADGRVHEGAFSTSAEIAARPIRLEANVSTTHNIDFDFVGISEVQREQSIPGLQAETTYEPTGLGLQHHRQAAAVGEASNAPLPTRFVKALHGTGDYVVEPGVLGSFMFQEKSTMRIREGGGGSG